MCGLIKADGKDAVTPFFKLLDDDIFMSSLRFFDSCSLSTITRLMAENGALNNKGGTSV